MQVNLECIAHAAMDLNSCLRRQHRRIDSRHFGRVNRPTAFNGRQMDHGPGKLDFGEDVCQLMFDGLKGAYGLSELMPVFGVFHGHIHHALRKANELRGGEDRAVVVSERVLHSNYLRFIRVYGVVD